MKQLASIILSFLFVLSTHSQALNAPAVQAGDFFTISVATPLPIGEAGENMVWDYSQAEFIQNFYGQIHPSIPSTFQDDYPNAAWIRTLGGGEYYYNFGPEIYEYYGGVENGLSYPYLDSEEFYPFPFEYGQTHLDSSFNEFSIQGVSITRTIITNSANDGYGTLNLPNQITYDDVSRVRIYRFISDTSLLGSSSIIVDQTAFMTSNFAIPILSHSQITINSDSGVDEIELMEYLLSYSVDTDEIEVDQFAMFPNPASDRVTLKWFEGDSFIEVYDAAGRVVESLQSTPGLPLVSFDVSRWDAGVYSVCFTTSEGINTKKLVVE